MSPSLQSPTTNRAADLASKRRRFQPPITSFFSTTSTPPSEDNANVTTDRSHHLSHNHYSAATCSPTPIVPTKVQASLLSVGMRVRKSVAEGYKTRLAKSDSSFSELAPYSGMRSHSAPMNLITDDEGDAFSLPSSSQESNAGGQKRSYDMDFDIDDSGDENDVAASGLDLTAHNATFMGRTILAPKLNQQRRRFVALRKHATISEGMGMDIDDFEEASFLRSREEVDMEYGSVSRNSEIEMGGV
ncbi:hypothetical protein AAWM_08987 [Aspergillus awamori]|uniref:Contig An01c0400, genomic contig n=6 Tax=Aspergillus TaxID=5052 RepID=A2QAY3_ASPNC|nr:uncharacterized protein An01g13210 [Aspergillus niger]XP_025455379.1 uncharacterized protein BO96DRAFT_411678 [Aspergillus niger CBS 101883]EHA27054.1 hypothetical protein ASPNIDRAFT_171322 [Aspergillus niger ATCC 1015]RDH18768.1 hypothetical protein M747DRAFT_297057 [Aspergillus niger ATCC 13496]RDK43238.1 hypothetical protein M752DRAFT_275496 [Aspergillus phoenicis ATCC 13157]GCB26102.1 hypothetical protein AAWM_08987 [Aspergillus awamori]KAI2819054.1 hypothetical protein CBS115989_4667 |eukprot:XP_001389722.1 hypothetical protein ANI_1_3228014 [Aspergillus niger CBS 513.88]